MNTINVEEHIPAFSMWKMLNETVPVLRKGDCSEASIKKLAAIIQSKEGTNIFISHKDPMLSFQQFQEIGNRYKAFTTWILGQFFFLLSLERLEKLHDIIIDVQLCILDQLSRTQLHIYHDLSEEYYKAFSNLVQYSNYSVQQTFVLELFLPQKYEDLEENLDLQQVFVEISSKSQCASTLEKLTRFIKPFLKESFIFYSFGNSTYEVLDCLLALLSKSNESLRIKVIEIFIDILRNSKNKFYRYNSDIMKRMLTFSGLYEQYVYKIYDSEIDLHNNNLEHFESLLVLYLELETDWRRYFKNVERILQYLFQKQFECNNKIKPSNMVLLTCNTNITMTNYVAPDFKIELAADLKQLSLFYYFKPVISDEISKWESISSDIQAFNPDVSPTYSKVYDQLMENLKQSDCQENNCSLDQFLKYFKSVANMLIEIKLELVKDKHVFCRVQFFEEKKLMHHVLSKFASHSNKCENSTIALTQMFDFFIIFPLVTNSKNIECIFGFLTQSLLNALNINSDIGNQDFIGGDWELRKHIKYFLNFLLSNNNISKNSLLQCVKDFFIIVASGLIDLRNYQIRNIEVLYIKVCKTLLETTDWELICLVIETIPLVSVLFENMDNFINQVLIQILMIKNPSVQEKTMAMLPSILCMTSADFSKALKWDCSSSRLITTFFCVECHLKSSIDQKTRGEFLKSELKVEEAITNFSRICVEETLNNFVLKYALAHLSGDSANLKVAALSMLPSLSSHVKQFHSKGFIAIWAELAGDSDKDVRKKFTNVIGSFLTNAQNNSTIPRNVLQENEEVIFQTILDLSKKSLKYSDYDLQYCLLNTIDEITQLGSETIILEMMKILLYFIMIPTSKYSLIAVNKCFTLARRHDTSTTSIYNQNKREYCEVIAHLCSVNQVLINYNLFTSMEKVSPMLGFYGSKDFIVQEINYILPFFISKIVAIPTVTKLIEEMAQMIEMDVSEMLCCKYGYIFIHIFLETLPKEEFKQCMMYLEKTSGMSGPSLRKRNFRIILNELLLNFHEKKDRVSLALSLLMEEDSESKATSVQEYLQCHFLGVLIYFDVKFISKTLRKDKFLLSLADLFRYMGSKHIIPLRFKVIAMLQTSDNEKFPVLKCEVWDAFVRTCEIEYLGPQLALIIVSILPLLNYCPAKVNDIFKYLIVENEHHVKTYIADLFFVNNPKIDYEIDRVIKKYLANLKKCPLKEKMQQFIKYLSHESMEVRLQSLKHLKNCLEQSREELDKMILDYNGIDSSIVELIDILTLGCREKDKSLKLSCGEVIGELGAIEPSHLPRRYTHDQSLFSFYITEDSFIMSSLNELIKALQTVKNTQSIDRYSLAIQEILKLHGISPGNSILWDEFPETQREVMLPLLSSRYMIAQPNLASNLPTPIYGSNSGASFQSWLYNWTCSLISSLPADKKSLLKVCLPSMKQDNRILLHFLPYVLLHALLEGEDRISEKCFIEIQTITSSFTDQKTLDPKVLNLRPISITGIQVEPQSVTPEELKQTLCTKVVFLVLDFLDRWLREWHWQKGLNGRASEHYSFIQHFLSELCKLQLAKCNYHCGEYPRALLYLEDYISEHPSEISQHLSFLAELYAQLEEPDGVDGATKLQHNEPSVEQRILALEVSGKLADATTCYEQMLQPLHLNHIQGLVQCYLDLENVNTALNFVRGALDKQPDFGNMLLEMQAEPLWRLGQYEELDSLLKKPDLTKNTSWGVAVGRALLFFKEGKRDEFQVILDEMMREQVESFGAATLEEGAYQHGYGYISKLHALNELQQVEKIVSELLLKPNDQQFAHSLITKLMNEWSLRLKIVQESVRTIEPLLCLRRVSLNLAKVIARDKVPGAVPTFDTLIGECWMQSAKTARATGMHQQAYTYLIKAEEYSPKTLFLEKAKLHWLREEHEQALRTLRRGLEIILPEGTAMDDLSLDSRKMCAEARLLIATYNDEISNVDVEMNLLHYKRAVDIYKEWEKSMVCLAQYHDKIFQTYSDEERDSKGGDIQLYMINYFGKSLQYGTTYIYQSMPRLLSIWFDYGTRLLEVTLSSVKEERKKMLLSMTKLIDSFLERLPTYVFLTAFSQLVSRICHPQREVYGELKCIIIKLLQQYPQQSLWMIISVIKSSYAVRSKRCAEILSDPRLKTVTLSKLVKDFTSLAEKLMELCNKEIPSDVNSLSVSTLLRSLPRMLVKDDFSEIMMPTYKFRKLILPNPDFNSGQHNPFPNHYVHIAGIEDELNVLTSLQRPRKITLKGSDGKRYIYMLKPKDDLRKDFRLMEFNDIVNQLLARDGEARQRRLSIRLYSVAPLNEECGLIEWVPNLVGLRPVLMKLYKQRGLAMQGRELKQACCNIRDPLEKKREVFLKKFLPKHPPILNEWFRKTFPDAQSWLTARTDYIRTTAVMSMAGYILGLGDRHGENISLDSTCGDVVHVDFNCLFNKGEKFDWPERVPFRLTHNMVAAMGPLGVEGPFRKSCAITLRVLRVNTNTLMSIVAPFVYDPLVSWPRNISALQNVHNAERTNEEALDHIKNIELRLQGRVKTRHRTSLMPLSVEGQTNYLINEAVSIDNLCQMYVGWGPYL